MNANKYKIIDHQVNYAEHRAVEVFPVTWLICSKYLFISYNGYCFCSGGICEKFKKYVFEKKERLEVR